MRQDPPVGELVHHHHRQAEHQHQEVPECNAGQQVVPGGPHVEVVPHDAHDRHVAHHAHGEQQAGQQEHAVGRVRPVARRVEGVEEPRGVRGISTATDIVADVPDARFRPAVARGAVSESFSKDWPKVDCCSSSSAPRARRRLRSTSRSSISARGRRGPAPGRRAAPRPPGRSTLSAPVNSRLRHNHRPAGGSMAETRGVRTEPVRFHDNRAELDEETLKFFCSQPRVPKLPILLLAFPTLELDSVGPLGVRAGGAGGGGGGGGGGQVLVSWLHQIPEDRAQTASLPLGAPVAPVAPVTPVAPHGPARHHPLLLLHLGEPLEQLPDLVVRQFGRPLRLRAAASGLRGRTDKVYSNDNAPPHRKLTHGVNNYHAMINSSETLRGEERRKGDEEERRGGMERRRGNM
ncbi:hypothetical protein EYF80_050842 [Liparis tanakae]|uniref:Uncharacterized protein n=1 Tax=Liparis tanakae TaxID=230148 RepID=A0A4Z2FF04_9TELE|nr:hypothetical protein EYF80_050842 [Liparis tanakae]